MGHQRIEVVMFARRFSGEFRWLGLALLLGTVGLGCSQEAATDEAAGLAADSVAYFQAREMEEGPEQMAAIEALIDKFPSSKWTERAYSKFVSLALEHAPERAESILHTFQETDFESPNPYNAVGWHLAEEEKHLDLAIPILEKAVAKARAGDDTDMLASCIDSEAWAHYKAGNYAVAVERMEEAYEIIGPGNDEIDMHMAVIYDAADMDDKALPIYISLLGHMEHRGYRQSVSEIVSATGGSMEEINAEIDALREAGAKEAPEVTLPTLADGTPLSLSDYRGKVVLLNFWHPT